MISIADKAWADLGPLSVPAAHAPVKQAQAL
jgi:hypothetical protein